MRFSALIKLLLLSFLFLDLPGWASEFEEGVKFSKDKNWMEAEKSFRTFLEKNPTNANGYYNLGTTLAARQKETEAIWALEKAVKLNPNLKEARANLQYCYGKLGIQETWEPALPYFKDKAYQLGINFWTYTSIALAFILAVLVFFSIVTAKTNTRKITVIFSVLIAIGLFFTIQNALTGFSFKYNETHVVLMQDENSVFQNADGNMKIDLKLKQGNRFEIEEMTNSRIGLLMKNQQIVWIERNSVRFI